MSDIYKYISKIYGLNHYRIDKTLRDSLRYYLGSELDLNHIGILSGREIYAASYYTDRIGNPVLLNWSIDGERVDRVILPPILLDILNKLISEYGVIRIPYRGGPWHSFYTSLYLISDPGISCILTVTSQTAYAIHKYGDDGLRDHLPYLLGEREELMFGATWFTEIQGGSDLGANLTEAYLEDGSWRITGDRKYFASNAGLADLALVSARPRGAAMGAKGLALFLVPRINSRGELNYRVTRLKYKSGTISVPTGEVEFNASEAYPIGELDKGIYYIMENLMVARLANVAGAVGIARRASLEALYYTRVREAFGRRIIEHPLIRRDLVEMELMVTGGLVLGFKAIDQFNKSWGATPPYNDEYNYARILTHISKNYTADIASEVTRLAMEIYGGIGFLQEFPVEKWHREALITPIWEGTSNIHALEMLEAIHKKGADKMLLRDIGGIAEDNRDTSRIAMKAYRNIVDALGRLRRGNISYIQAISKDILSEIAHNISSILMIDMGSRLGIDRYIWMAETYYRRFIEHRHYPEDSINLLDNILSIDLFSQP